MRLRFTPLLAALTLAAAPLAAPAAPAPVTVHIKNFAFVPAAVAVPAGTTVIFTNDDDEPHTATAYDASFDSDAIDTNESWKHVFVKPGTYTYFCEMHPMMKGTLVVKGAP